MSKVGESERSGQNRIVRLFQEKLGYQYLGNWEDRENNSNIEEAELRRYLHGKYSDELITKAIFALKKEASINTNDDLYTINKEVYSMLRYGTAKKVEALSKHETVHFIDWENPANNNFAIAEEVTLKGKKERRPDIVLYINGIAIGVLELKRASVSSQRRNQTKPEQSNKVFQYAVFPDNTSSISRKRQQWSILWHNQNRREVFSEVERRQ